VRGSHCVVTLFITVCLQITYRIRCFMSCQVDKLLQTVVDKHGQIDGVANCIGTVELTKPLHITSEAEFRTTMDNNVLTAFNTVKGAVRPSQARYLE